MTKLLEISLFLHYRHYITFPTRSYNAPCRVPISLLESILPRPVSRANFTRRMDHITPRAAPIPLRERTLERNLERNLGRNLERTLGCP